MDIEKIGLYIAKCRKDQNLTQEQLAKQLGVTAKAVSKWECGKGLPDIAIMQDLCYVLKTNLINLLNGDNNTSTKFYILKLGGTLYTKKDRHRPQPNIVCNQKLLDNQITKIKDIEDKPIKYTVEVKIEGFSISEKDNCTIGILYASDDTGKLEVSMWDDGIIESRKIINQIEINHVYRMSGLIVESSRWNDELIKTLYAEELIRIK